MSLREIGCSERARMRGSSSSLSFTEPVTARLYGDWTVIDGLLYLATQRLNASHLEPTLSVWRGRGKPSREFGGERRKKKRGPRRAEGIKTRLGTGGRGDCRYSLQRRAPRES